jgi:hypothetical protein
MLEKRGKVLDLLNGLRFIALLVGNDIAPTFVRFSGRVECQEKRVICATGLDCQ